MSIAYFILYWVEWQSGDCDGLYFFFWKGWFR